MIVNFRILFFKNSEYKFSVKCNFCSGRMHLRPEALLNQEILTNLKKKQGVCNRRDLDASNNKSCFCNSKVSMSCDPV
jgi:hypothetical protein